jgi:hypothetical protein
MAEQRDAADGYGLHAPPPPAARAVRGDRAALLHNMLAAGEAIVR